MAGVFSDSSPDPGEHPVSLWLARQPLVPPAVVPGWLSHYERKVASDLSARRLGEFVHSRWLIRQALSASSGQAPSLCRPVDGRPVTSVEPAGWHLSLSHSHGLSACALSAQAGIGVDIEPIDRSSQWQRVVRRWFTRREQDWLLARADEAAFLRVWTLKEAWLKATGRGIANNLQSLEILADGTMTGDLPETDWQAALAETGGFMITVVWKGENTAALPQLMQVTTDEDYGITPARAEPVRGLHWQRQTIRTREP